MPDDRVQQMAGDELEPSTEFLVSMRHRLVAEWRGEVQFAPEQPAAPRSSRVWWLAAAAAVLVVMLAVAWLGSAAPSRRVQHPAATSTPLSPTTVPSTALGHVWVVTAVGDVPWKSPNLPSFAFDEAGLLAGSGFGGLSVAGPYTFTSEFDVRTDRITAERFDRTDLDGFDEIRRYRFGNAGSFTLDVDGTMRVDGGGCEVAVTGTYAFDADRLQFDVDVPECAVPDPDFRAWLQQMNTTGARFSFHAGVAPGLWTEIDGAVTRLSFAPPALVPHALGDDATPDAAGLRVAEWGGAELTALGVVLDEANLGVRIDGALVALAADGAQLQVVSDRGLVVGAVALDPGYSRLTVGPGDVAALVGVSGESRVSVRQSTIGQPAPPSVLVGVQGPTPECSFDVQLGTRHWTVAQHDCASALLAPVGLDNGSVVALTRDTVSSGGSDPVIELAAIRLNVDGSQQRVVLGRHAVDGAEGWVTVQVTETGAFVLFHYPDDEVVLYRYLFV
jgi:hypothetical protein